MDEAGRELQQDQASSARLALAGGLDAEEIGAGERLGPLRVNRYRKVDGRALILYAHVSTSAEEPLPSSIASPRP